MKYSIIIIFICYFTHTNAQTFVVPNTNDLVLECMKVKGEIPSKQMVIWFPEDFWSIIGKQMKISPEYVQKIAKNMGEYLLFAVVDYNISNEGKITFKTDEQIRKTLQLLDSSKHIYLPLNENDISEESNRMIDFLKPVMKNLLGQFGEGMKLYLFSSLKDKSGKNSIVLHKENSFTLQWNTVKFNWKLPFASVLPLKYCPIDNEELKGNWNYCPIHGKKLN
jgi:hypothetical protein